MQHKNIQSERYIMLENKIIYLDNGDTSKLDQEVLDYMLPYFTQNFGNPASLHQLGIEADENLAEARKLIADLINANPQELIFTSGATEANNLAILGLADYYQSKKHLIISRIEHSSVRETARYLIRKGYEVDEIGVDGEGFLNLAELESKIRPDTLLVSIVYANYEIGTIQDITKIGEICRKNKVFFHTDAAQAFGKIKLDVVAENIDLMTINAHKMHGPKGVGVLYVKNGIKLGKLMEGGAHENNRRPGSENMPAIMGMAKAAEIAYRDLEQNNTIILAMRNRLAEGLMQIPHVFYNGPKGANLAKRLVNNCDITFQYIEGEAILMHLSLRNICVSSGSACSSKTLEPSHVLTAIGLKHEQAHGSIRFTVSKDTTIEDVDTTIKALTEVVGILRNMSAFIPEEHSELINPDAKTFYKER